MDSFYIKEIRVWGENAALSTIDFRRGVNIIYGSSNTGKSYVISAIDFMFGASEPPFEKEDTGYDTVSILMENDGGETFYAERKILDGEDGSRGDTKITVRTSLEDIPDETYSVKSGSSEQASYNSWILPRLLGITEPVMLIATQQLKKQRLTFRSFCHQFILSEEHIDTKKTIVDNPKHSSITTSVNALSYLLIGSADDGTQFDTPEMRKAKKNAVIGYIRDVIEVYDDRRNTLRAQLEEADDVSVEEQIKGIIDELSDIDAHMASLNRQIHELSASISRKEDELGEGLLLNDRYEMLESQYESDLRRLHFIVEGETNNVGQHIETCPFCEHEIVRPMNGEPYADAARAEIEKITSLLEGLRETKSELALRIDELKTEIADLVSRRSVLAGRFNAEYAPKAAMLRKNLADYRQIISWRSELAAKEEELETLRREIQEKEDEDDSGEKYDAKKHFDEELFSALSKTVASAIKDCGYPGFHDAMISKAKFDVVVNGKPKKSEGEGYRSFLNTAFAFSLMKFIEENGQYAPRMLVLDSPIQALSENEDIPFADSMKASLFTYMLENCGECQVIIAENLLPYGVDFSNAKITHFTKSEQGRYGFFLSPQEEGKGALSDAEGGDSVAAED